MNHLLTAHDLQAISTVVEASLDRLATISRRSTGTSEIGTPLSGYSVVAAHIPCRVGPDRQSQAETVLAGQVSAIESVIITFGQGGRDLVHHNDQILLEDTNFLYEVVQLDAGKSTDYLRECRVVQVLVSNG